LQFDDLQVPEKMRATACTLDEGGACGGRFGFGQRECEFVPVRSGRVGWDPRGKKERGDEEGKTFHEVVWERQWVTE
jgi:hypothetical protein